jgi:hypothetical protein
MVRSRPWAPFALFHANLRFLRSRSLNGTQSFLTGSQPSIRRCGLQFEWLAPSLLHRDGDARGAAGSRSSARGGQAMPRCRPGAARRRFSAAPLARAETGLTRPDCAPRSGGGPLEAPPHGTYGPHLSGLSPSDVLQCSLESRVCGSVSVAQRCARSSGQNGVRRGGDPY